MTRLALIIIIAILLGAPVAPAKASPVPEPPGVALEATALIQGSPAPFSGILMPAPQHKELLGKVHDAAELATDLAECRGETEIQVAQLLRDRDSCLASWSDCRADLTSQITPPEPSGIGWGTATLLALSSVTLGLLVGVLAF